jgi:hypothetical protein
MLQAFYMDIAKVDRDVAYVASVSEVCASVSEICCKRLFKMFCMFQTYIASVFISMLHMFRYAYVASVYSKCFIYFRRMLQVFHLDVAYVAIIFYKYFTCFRRMI